MKSNEDNKTWISNIFGTKHFLCLKQVYCCLTFVFVYMFVLSAFSFQSKYNFYVSSTGPVLLEWKKN